MRSLQEERSFMYCEPQPPDVATGSYNVCILLLWIGIYLHKANARRWLMMFLQMEVYHDDKDAKLRDGHGQGRGTTFNA